MSVQGWQPLPAGSSLPPHTWGKDHFSTLAYLETCAVDHSGSVSNARLRCDARLHPAVVDRLPVEAREYPTILRDDKLQAGHDRESARRKPQGFSPGGPVRPAPWLGRRAFPRL